MKQWIRRTFFTNKLLERLLLLIQRIPGCYSLSFKLFAPNDLYPSGSRRIVKRGGLLFDLDISDYQQWLIYFNSDSDSSKTILKYLKASDEVIFDIGANIGQTSLWINQHLGHSGTKHFIYAFEPFPSTFHQLRKNLSLNKIEAIIPVNQALGSEIAELKMVEDCPTNSGGFRMSTGQTTKSESISVTATTLDAFVADQGLKTVDFIKIDVEGYELHVLKGSEQTLRTFHPVLFIEYCPENLEKQGSDPNELINYLSEIGYVISDAHTNIPVSEWALVPGMTDLICTFTTIPKP